MNKRRRNSCVCCLILLLISFIVVGFSLMVIVTIVFKSSAKVLHFCELCKKKIRILPTIKVNMLSIKFIHNSAVHKPLHIRSKLQIFTDLVQKSRVVSIFPDIGLIVPDETRLKQSILHNCTICNLLYISIFAIYLK